MVRNGVSRSIFQPAVYGRVLLGWPHHSVSTRKLVTRVKMRSRSAEALFRG